MISRRDAPEATNQKMKLILKKEGMALGIAEIQIITRMKDGNLWCQFKGFANTDEILIEKAKAFAPVLFGLISEDTKSLFEELKEENVDAKKYGEVFFEMVLFNLHYVDRSAFSHLGAEKRNIFMDALVIEFGEAMSITDDVGIEAAQFRSSFLEAYEERQEEYIKYKKSFPENKESPKDTLFWEFGKKITRVLDLENNFWVIMRVTNNTFTKYTELELSELFSGKEEKKGTITQFLELFKLSFNWSGRFSRRQFITYNVGIFFIVLSIILLIMLTGLHVNSGTTEMYGLLTLAVIGQISNSIAVIRRLHDLDKSGWYYLLMYTPIVLNVLIVFYVCYIYLLAKKGKEIGETQWE